MRMLRARLAIVVGAVLPLPWLLLAQCGGDDTSQPGADASADAIGHDGTSFDGTTVDVRAPDGPSSADSSMADSTADGGAADGADAADAADAVEEPPYRIPCVPTSTGSGDGGDAGGGEAGMPESGAADDGAAGEAGSGAGDGGGAGEGGDAGDGGGPGSCPGTMTCCGGFCTDTTKDPQNCGACGTTCASAQFCNGTACDDAALQNLCANPLATVVMDPLSPDNEAGAALGAGLMKSCMPAVTVTTAAQDSGLVEDPVSGRPWVGGSDTLVFGGGFYGQAGVAYMETHKLAPLVAGVGAGNMSFIRNATTNADVVSVPQSTLTAHHDYFVLEVAVEPMSGTLCFMGYGLLVPGTSAAAYFFQNNVVVNPTMFPGAWYVYEWTDTDNDGVPSTADMFKLVGSG
jgi:hypothetical protein